MVYRVTQARVDRDQALRQRIVEVAQARVVEGGFAALTMQALAADAGMATGSLYRHFRNKGELAAEVFARASQHEVDALAEAFRAEGSPAARLREGLGRFATRAWHSRRLAYALIAEPVDPEVDFQRLCFREAYAALFIALLEEGVAAGAFRVASVPLAAACLVGAIAESLVGPLSSRTQAANDAGPGLDEVIRALTHFCLGAVGARPEEE